MLLSIMLASLGLDTLGTDGGTDEQEYPQCFGEQYASYHQRTWMFIPFLL